MWPFNLLAALPSLISGAFGTVNNITNAISNEKINARKALTEEDRIAAEERVKTLEARRDVMIEEGRGSRINMIMRAALAGCVLIVLAKLMVWDKVIGSLAGCSAAPKGTCGIFTTDQLDDNQWKVIMIVIGFYFLYEAVRAGRK